MNVHGLTYGHPYAGTQQALSNYSCRTQWSYHYSLLPYPFIVLDIPASLLIDTVLLPLDIFIEPKVERKFAIFIDNDCG
jgi:uncharacterized protein YceK